MLLLLSPQSMHWVFNSVCRPCRGAHLFRVNTSFPPSAARACSPFKFARSLCPPRASLHAEQLSLNRRTELQPLSCAQMEEMAAPDGQDEAMTGVIQLLVFDKETETEKEVAVDLPVEAMDLSPFSTLVRLPEALRKHALNMHELTVASGEEYCRFVVHSCA
jgi:hypothetical protein